MEIIKPRRCIICNNTIDFQELRQCSFCGPRGEEPPYFCILKCCEKGCRTRQCTAHPTCWEVHLPAYQGMRALHHKVDQLPEIFVTAVTYSESDPRKQQNLHDEDRIAQWFIIRVGAPGREQTRLCVSDRFRQLCDPGISENRWSVNQYPSFVSFIGDTGTGKSTLVRAMILMGQVNASGLHSPSNGETPENDRVSDFRAVLAARINGPVTRTANLEHLTDPTSSGVHLYKDAAQSYSPRASQATDFRREETPILFADCEGFRAGVAQTNAGRGTTVTDISDDLSSLRTDAPPVTSRLQEAGWDTNPNLLFERPITSPDYGGRGKEGAELFYARFLYAFSDVVVFVTKEDQHLQEDMQRLLEWAASAVDKSVNHLAKKTLIIVRNMASRHATEFYDRHFLKRSTFENLGNLWEGSAALGEFRKEYNKKHNLWQRHIHTNKQLFEVFFQEVQVCYVPEKVKAPTDQLFQQYRELREQIDLASKAGQELRLRSWTRYNIPTLSHLLNRAFEHFRTSDKPFDFYKAARKDNPNPVSESDHIANFLRHIRLSQDRFAARLSPSEADRLFCQAVSTCLVSWAVRNLSQAYEPEDIFTRDLQYRCADGIRTYCEKYQNCGFRFDTGSKCITRRRPGHADHCDEKGRRIAGSFDPSEYQEDSTLTVNKIRKLFVDNYRRLCSDTPGAPGLPAPPTLAGYRADSLGEFASFWKRTKSNKTCFTCLQAVPDHVLSCGHGYCPDCVKEFGRKSENYEYGVVMEYCALCEAEWRDRHAQLIRLKPKCAGVRILSLDGGGVRGMIELSILERLEQRVGLRIPIRDLFDLIIGTSTGGIIALGLAMTDFTTTDMKMKFAELSEETFKSRREGSLLTAIDPFQFTSKTLMLLRFFDSIYPTSPLRRGLQQLFGPHLKLFSSATVQQQQRSTRVAVTATKNTAADRCLITNYNRPDFASQEDIEREDDFEREDEDDKEMKVWEAGLATAAAPFYFRQFEKAETSKNYVDGALHANLPVDYALEEMDNLWSKASGGVSLDALISIGTGIQQKDLVMPKILEIGGFKQIIVRFQNNINSQKLWEGFVNKASIPPEVRQRVHRLNALIQNDYIGIDDYKKMKAMDEMVAQQVEITPKMSPLALDIARAADTLAASLFFFEPNPPNFGDTSFNLCVPGARFELTGTIRCRLAKNSQELKRLVDLVDGFWLREINSATRQTPSMDRDDDRISHERINLDHSRQWTLLQLPTGWRENVRIRGDWLKLDCTIRTYEQTETQQVIAVTLRPPREERKSYVPSPVYISGFPISLKDLKRKAGWP